MAKGGSLSTLLTIGLVGGAIFVAWDYFGNPPCQKMIPFFNAGCPGGAGGSSVGGYGERVGLVMDPMKVGDWLRSIQRSADTEWYRAKTRLVEGSTRTAGQPVKNVRFTPPAQPAYGPKSIGTSQPIKLQSRFTPGGARSGAPADVISKSKFIPPKSKYIPPGRGAPRASSPASFEEFMRGISEAFQLRTTPKTLNQYIEWLKAGGKDPGLRLWESLGGQVKGGKPVISAAGKPVFRPR